MTSREFLKEMIHLSVNGLRYPHRRRKQLINHLIVLTYHSFCRDRDENLHSSLYYKKFEKQIKYLQSHFDIQPLRVAIDHLFSSNDSTPRTNRPMLAVTIDDGFEDNYIYAFPILKKYCIPATIFLVTDFVDNRCPPWPTQIREALEKTTKNAIEYPVAMSVSNFHQKAKAVEAIKFEWQVCAPDIRFKKLEEFRQHLEVKKESSCQPLSWDQIKEMAKWKIDFGAHTVYHSILPFMEGEVISSELSRCKARIEEQLQTACCLLAYPDGKADEKSRLLAMDTGFSAAVTQYIGTNGATTDRYMMKRIEIPSNEYFSTFRCRASLATIKAIVRRQHDI